MVLGVDVGFWVVKAKKSFFHYQICNTTLSTQHHFTSARLTG